MSSITIQKYSGTGNIYIEGLFFKPIQIERLIPLKKAIEAYFKREMETYNNNQIQVLPCKRCGCLTKITFPFCIICKEEGEEERQEIEIDINFSNVKYKKAKDQNSTHQDWIDTLSWFNEKPWKF